MPTVRGYRQSVRSPELRPVADTSIPEKPSADVYGAQVGRAVEGLGETVTRVGGYLGAEANRIHEEALRIADFDMVQAADNQLEAASRQLRDQALTTKGLAARGIVGDIQQQYDDAAGKIAGTLKTERQQREFENRRNRRWNDLANTLDAHGRAEDAAWREAETKTGIANATSDAIRNAANPPERDRYLLELRAKANNFADGAGLGPEARAALLGGALTDAHAGIVYHFLDANQDQAARAYFDQVQGEITGVDRNGESVKDKLSKALAAGNTKAEAQRQSDAIVAAGGTLTAQRDKAKAIEDPDVRDLTLRYIEHEHDVAKAEALASDENLMVKAGNLVDQGGLRAVPTSVWQQLTPAQKTSLEQYAKRNVSGDPEGKTDLATYYDLKQQAVSDPDAFAKRNLLDLRHKFSRSDFKSMVDLQMGIRKGDKPKTDKELKSFLTNSQVMTSILDEFKLKADSTEGRALLWELERRVERAQIASGGKELTPTEIREQAQDLMQTVVLQPGSVWNLFGRGRTGPLSDVSKRVADLTVADIPKADRDLIIGRLRDKGQTVTDALLLDLWIKWKRELGAVK